MRIPGRAVAAAIVLTLTACGWTSPPTATLAGPRGAVMSVAGLDASFVSTVDHLSQTAAPDDILEFAAARERADLVEAKRAAEQADLPAPPWWDGECNANRSPGAKPLGASYRGVQACGPQPGKADGRLVRFFDGAWGEYEWQCTELVYRFMYLAYGVKPYIGNGDEVVDNYRPAMGGNLVKVVNNGRELPSAGDILSYDSVHSSIVTNVDVDERGNGMITVLEQNAPNNGRATLRVTNFRIANVKNWLHRVSE